MNFNYSRTTNDDLTAAKKAESAHWKRRAVNMKATMIFPAKGLRELQEKKINIVRISEGDAIIYTGETPQMSDTFYLQIDVSNSPSISCWIVKKSPRAIHCYFQQELFTSTLERVITEYEMRSTLEELWSVEHEDTQDAAK